MDMGKDKEKALTNQMDWQEILMVFHIPPLEVGNLARDMMDKQVKHDWPGWSPAYERAHQARQPVHSQDNLFSPEPHAPGDE